VEQFIVEPVPKVLSIVLDTDPQQITTADSAVGKVILETYDGRDVTITLYNEVLGGTVDVAPLGNPQFVPANDPVIFDFGQLDEGTYKIVATLDAPCKKCSTSRIFSLNRPIRADPVPEMDGLLVMLVAVVVVAVIFFSKKK
jgi:hypothetical protein